MTNSIKHRDAGFTLVELAIVLVIIGLIVGGVLVGQDLIKAATMRAATKQIEQYDAAANTFRNKYNGLPGDLQQPDYFFPDAGFLNTDGEPGHGDGDGIIDSYDSSTSKICRNSACVSGESALFWTELALSGLISNPTLTIVDASADVKPNDDNIPPSKLGKGARISINSY